MESSRAVRVHRVGTITCGCTLIIFGMLFLLHMIVPAFSYTFIFRLWPCIFIMLGVEILIGNSSKKEDMFVYDKGAVFLLVVLAVFAMLMGFTDYCMTHIAVQPGCVSIQ